jgi:two-component system cell cycle sensor histidine kinase/response regulator CckA
MIETLDALLDGLPCGAAWLCRDLKLRYCNRRLEGWIGRPRAELLGGSLEEVLGAELAAEIRPLIGQVLAGEPASRPVRLAGSRHGPQQVMLRLRPYRGEGGEVDAVLLSAERIPDVGGPARSHAEQGIEEVQRVARIGTYHTDLKASTWTASDGFCRIFGFEPGGVYTQEEFQAIVHPDDLDAVMAEFVACLTERRPFDFEYRCVRRLTGAVIDVRSTSQIFWDELGNPDHIIGIKQDITERKELARQLVASQRMEAIGHLAGGIAHDFNNMLAAIMGFTELVMMTTPRDAGAYAHLEQVQAASLRAKALVQQLLAFTKRRIVAPRVIQLNDTIDGVDRLLRRLLGEHIELDTRLAPDLWQVRFDPGAIEQVIVNLAVNARDAMPRGGRLTIESFNTTMDARVALGAGGELDPGPYVVIAVKDTGCGMDADTQLRIFEPFFTTKPEGHGTGLGLATCYGLVTQAGGCIAVRSEPGQGATFEVYLPRAAAEAEEPVVAPVVNVRTGSERVLVVEDDAAVRSMASKMLHQLGYQVLAASGASGALQLLGQSEGPVHLLLTDVVIPGMSGTELAKAVQARSPRTRVLYMSGYTTSAIVNQGELDEGVVLLQKPFGFEDLGLLVRRVLDA